MSRGLGALQREILGTLDEAKAAPLRYAGGRAHLASYGAVESGPGWVYAGSLPVQLPVGVYDLRASCRFLAERRGAVYGHDRYVDGRFQASFSRAARTLIERGALIRCDHCGRPLTLWATRGRQRRFVCRPDA